MFQKYSFNIESKKLDDINIVKNNINNQKNNFFYNEKRIELGEFIINNKITHAHVSKSLAQFEERFLKLFRLNKYDIMTFKRQFGTKWEIPINLPFISPNTNINFLPVSALPHHTSYLIFSIVPND